MALTAPSTGVRSVDELRGTSGNEYRRLAFSPDGRWLAATTDFGRLELWDWAPGLLVSTGPDADGCDLAWAPDARRLAVTWGEGVSIVDLASGGSRHVEAGAPSWSLAWTPDGARLAVGLSTGAIQLLDAASGTPVRTIQGHAGAVPGLAVAPDGTRLASVGAEGEVRVEVSGSLLWEQRSAHGDDRVLRVAWSADGRSVLTVGEDEKLLRWDADSGAPAGVARGHTLGVFELAVGLAGRVIATASLDDTVRLWCADTLTELARLPAGNNAAGNWPGLTFHPTLPLLAAMGPEAQSVRIWELDPPRAR